MKMIFDHTKGKEHKYTIFVHYNSFIVDRCLYSTAKDANAAFEKLKDGAAPGEMLMLYDRKKEEFRKSWKFGE